MSSNTYVFLKDYIAMNTSELKAYLQAQINALESGHRPRMSMQEADSSRGKLNSPKACKQDACSSGSVSDCAHDASEPRYTYLQTKAKVERLCIYKEQHPQLLQQRLVREGYDSNQVHKAITWAESCGLISRERYVDCLIRSRISASKGLQGLRRELSNLGESLDATPGWPEVYGINPDAEYERALAWIMRHPTQAKRPLDAACAKLMRRGFSYDVARRAAKTWYEQL